MKSTGNELIDHYIKKCMGEDAKEYFDYNIAQAFVGDQTPVFLQDE